MTRSANAATSSSDLSVPAVTAAIDAGGGLLAAWTGAARTAKHNAPMIFDFTSRLRGNVFYVGKLARRADTHDERSEEHTSELQSLMRISYAVFCLKKNKKNTHNTYNHK